MLSSLFATFDFGSVEDSAFGHRFSLHVFGLMTGHYHYHYIYVCLCVCFVMGIVQLTWFVVVFDILIVVFIVIDRMCL